MTGKTIVQWQNSYSVGVRLIDEQHMELIKLTNKLFESCMAGQEKTRRTFLDTIHMAVDYVKYHFGTEERLMERINYPDLLRHKKEHADFVREVLLKVEDFKAGKSLAPISFVYFLRDWVLQHIAVCDKKMGDYLINMQKSGALRSIMLRIKRDKAKRRVEIQSA
jgi:hemerythrin